MVLAEFTQLRASPMAANFDATLQRFNFIEYAIVRGGKSEENIRIVSIYGLLKINLSITYLKY